MRYDLWWTQKQWMDEKNLKPNETKTYHLRTEKEQCVGSS